MISTAGKVVNAMLSDARVSGGVTIIRMLRREVESGPETISRNDLVCRLREIEAAYLGPGTPPPPFPGPSFSEKR